MAFGKRLNWIAGAVLSTISACTSACSLAPSAYDLEASLKQRDPTQVVFLGKVVAVENLTPQPRMVSEQKVQFEVLRLWRGRTQPPVVASIGVSEPSGTSCDGIGNLRMELRQTWLLVGNYESGVLRPSSLKSKLLVDGVLPIETLRILQSSE